MGCARTLPILGLLLASAMPAKAQPVAEFYRGKTVNVLIGVGVGGEYDLQARMIARYLGKHIPGNPNVVPQNMTGAGGINMANYLFAQAARDGTSIGMLGNNFPASQAVGVQGVRFDAVKFNWLGTIAPVVETMAVWHTAGVKTIDDLRQKEIVAGASGRGAITYSYPSMMNEYLGTKFKIVTGYPGGNQINLAMERGEVQARNNTWSSWRRPSRLGYATIRSPSSCRPARARPTSTRLRSRRWRKPRRSARSSNWSPPAPTSAARWRQRRTFRRIA
jgi:tripartite-type tricarboxylate transporter receptor subunit TctC